MKEKTFDEILEDYMAYESMTETQKLFVKNMMQKVCEAKIAECFRIANEKDVSIADEISDLPTDRINPENLIL